MIEISHMPVNHALEQIFVRHVRLGGVRATLMALRAFAALTGRSGSQARPARAHSPRSDFAAASTLTNTAQRGVRRIKGEINAIELSKLRINHKRKMDMQAYIRLSRKK